MAHTRKIHSLWVSVVLVLALSACGANPGASVSSNPADSNGPSIVVTTNILGDVVADLVGDDGSVEVLLPVGSDPHDFELSARQTGELREADLVIANGLNLEEGMTDSLESAQTDGTTVMYIADLVDPIEMDGSDHDHDHESESEHEDNHDHGGLDPHFWLDPVRMAQAVRLIGVELEDLDTTTDSMDWVGRAETLATEIEQAHEEFEDALSVIPPENRRLLSSHHALGYLASRYDFEVVGTVVPGGSTLGETSAGDVARLVELLESGDIPAIFADVTDTSDLTPTVAAEAGVEVVRLYTGSLGEPDSGAATYLEMMETNVERIAAALGG